jgi:hypothetical protein
MQYNSQFTSILELTDCFQVEFSCDVDGNLDAKANNGFVGAYVCNACRSHLGVCAREHDTENLLQARVCTLNNVCSFTSLSRLALDASVYICIMNFSFLPFVVASSARALSLCAFNQIAPFYFEKILY